MKDAAGFVVGLAVGERRLQSTPKFNPHSTVDMKNIENLQQRVAIGQLNIKECQLRHLKLSNKAQEHEYYPHLQDDEVGIGKNATILISPVFLLHRKTITTLSGICYNDSTI